MNHPKGDESTSLGERSSNCPQVLCTAAEPSPQKLRNCGGGGHLKGWNLCGGFRPFFLWQRKSGFSLLVGGPERDAPDRADGDDDLLRPDRKRDEAEPRLARKRRHGQALAAEQLDLHVLLRRVMRRSVLLDQTVYARDELF